MLLLLNNILRPTKVTRTFKPTISFAQEEIIIFAETENDIRSKIETAYSMYATWNAPPIPKLVFIGKSTSTLTGSYYVVYKDLSYNAESVARAIDILVKMTLTFGLEFSRVTRLVWNFICSFIYEIPNQARYASVINLIEQLVDNES